MMDCGARFLRTIMSILRALCGLPSVKRQNDIQVCKWMFTVLTIFFWSKYSKTIIVLIHSDQKKLLLELVLVKSKIINVLVLSSQPQPIPLTLTLIILDNTKTSSNNKLLFLISWMSGDDYCWQFQNNFQKTHWHKQRHYNVHVGSIKGQGFPPLGVRILDTQQKNKVLTPVRKRKYPRGLVLLSCLLQQ